MVEGYTLKATLQQKQSLSVRMLQAMQILQMDAQALNEYINKTAEENPVIDCDSGGTVEEMYEKLRQRISWLDSAPGTFTERMDSTQAEMDYKHASPYDRNTMTLAAFLYDQLDRIGLPKHKLTLCKYLVDMLDEDGYLEQEDIDAVLALGIPETTLFEAIGTLQQLEPAGVAARNLGECLRLQIERLSHAPTITISIAEHYLELLGKKRYRSIAKALDATERDVEEAASLIASLNPHPGAGFGEQRETEYIRPDLFIVEDGEGYHAVLNDAYLPRIRVNDYYQKLLKETDSEETRNYLKEKFSQASWLMDCLDRRNRTLQSCAETILEAHADFFAGKTAALAPLTIRSAAERVGVHESTLGRCVAGKYLQCRQGIFPLRYFFPQPATKDRGGISGQAVKLELVHLIRKEPSEKPFTDQKLSDMLAECGICISRRTVAKYRDQLGVAAASGRKQRSRGR